VCHGAEASSELAGKIRELGRRSSVLECDLTSRAAQDQLIENVLSEFGRLDVLVNNAGSIRRAPAVDTSDSDWDAIIELNLNSVFRLSRSAGRHMLARGSGKIINIASLLSFQGGVFVPSYAASKGGVAQVTKALANEWAGRGVNVNAIAPGYISTANTAALRADPERSRQLMERIPAGRFGEPEDIAGAALFLSSPLANYIHGHVLTVDGGWMAR